MAATPSPTIGDCTIVAATLRAPAMSTATIKAIITKPTATRGAVRVSLGDRR